MASKLQLICLICWLCAYLYQPAECAQPHIAVIGAGVHGLLAASEVKLRGWDVTVFEKEADILPVIPTLSLNGINYEYYSQAIYSSATFQHNGPNPSLNAFASRFNQTLVPWTASAIQHTLYYDTVKGPLPYPVVWESFFASPAGRQELVMQLAEAINLLNEVGTNASIPADLIDSGLVNGSESILQWAQQVDLPAYSDVAQVWWYAAECLLPAPLSAAIRLNMDLTSIGGLLRTALIALGVTEQQAAQLGIRDMLVAAEQTEVVSFYRLSNGVRGLLQAAIDTFGVTDNIMFNTPVLGVSNDGMVTTTQGTQQYDSVIVTVRPEAAFSMLSSPLKDVYEGGVTGLVDTWVVNASVLAETQLAANLSGLLLTTVSQNGSLPDRDGTPIFVIRQDTDLPVYAVAGYVSNEVNVLQSFDRAGSVLNNMGLVDVSVIAHERIPFPSQLASPAELDTFGQVYLLGEALAGIGLDVALPYVADRMETWFGPSVFAG